MTYWLFKSEPECFGIDALAKMPKQTEHWDGVRNYQARNMMRDLMQVGDEVFFYHSNCTPPGIVGTMKIVRAAYPDDSAWNLESDHFDSKSSPENPRWFMVDVKLVKKFKHMVTLETLRNHPSLKEMVVTRTGNRLSISPVTAKEWETILKLAGE